MITTEAAHIRHIRKSLGLTQAEFAARLNVSVQAVRHWEQGRREPTGLYKAALLQLVIDAKHQEQPA